MMMYKQKKLSYLHSLFYYELPANYKITEHELSHPELHKLINNKGNQFDLMLVECIYCPHAVLAEHFDCPIVFIAAAETSNVLHRFMGNDDDPFDYPDIQGVSTLNSHLSLKERVHSFLFNVLSEGISLATYLKSSELQRKYLPQFTSNYGDVMQQRTKLMLTNTNPYFGHLRPLMPNTVQVGFMHVQPPKEIENENLLKILNRSKVILMCSGSKIRMRDMGIELLEKFMRALGNFSETHEVLWKDEDFPHELVKVPANIHIIEYWIPVADILAHKNVELLISYSGLLTAYEAIDRQVPMIVFPITNDQPAIAKMMVRNKIAIAMDLNDFSSDELIGNIKEILKPIYRENVMILRKLIYDEKMSGLEKAVWHIERLLRWKNSTDYFCDHPKYVSNFRNYYIDLILMLTIGVIAVKVLMRKMTCKIKVQCDDNKT
jgi:glucuronosyltransferase